MIKLIKIWMQSKDCIIVAREIGEQSAVIGDINADQNDHWSARTIRDKLTTLKDDNELTDFLAKTNNLHLASLSFIQANNNPLQGFTSL
jgi:hypothetical protein